MTSEKFHVEQNCSTWTFLLHGQCPRQIWCMIVPIIGNSGLWEFCPNWEFSPNLGILGKLGIQAKFGNSAQIRNSTQIWEFYPYLGILPKIGNFPYFLESVQLSYPPPFGACFFFLLSCILIVFPPTNLPLCAQVSPIHMTAMFTFIMKRWVHWWWCMFSNIMAINIMVVNFWWQR